MGRISQRISERISGVMSGVTCPGCEERVVPVKPVAEPSPVPEGNHGRQRWSFIWRPPSGEVCPRCQFPLARYARRVKWIRLTSAGIVLLVGAMLLAILRLMSGPGGWALTGARILAVVGLAVFLAGLIGVVVGGRRSAGTG